MTDKRTITILQLYPRDMNIYGDWGNTLTLKRRLEWHGYVAILKEYNPGDTFPEDIDIIVGGGGQDRLVRSDRPDADQRARPRAPAADRPARHG